MERIRLPRDGAGRVPPPDRTLGSIPGRLSARLLRKFGSPERIFDAPLTEQELCSIPVRVAQAIFNQKPVKRAEKELAALRNIANCRLLYWTEPQCRVDPPSEV